MTENDPTGHRRRRVLTIGAPFAVGAAVGIGIYAGVRATSSGSGGTAPSAASQPAPVQTAPIARSSSFDAVTIYERDSPGVVDIVVTQHGPQRLFGGLSPFVPGGSSTTQAEGSGFVYDTAGDIVTANHVVAGATSITVRFKDGTTEKAKLVGRDPSSDVAVIKAPAPPGGFHPLAFGSSANVLPGEGVVAIGSPFGYQESITSGIVSAVGRDIQAPDGYTIPNAIQTDAAINHGNSGGPLIDASGRVIGINDQIATDGSGQTNAGVGFAIASASAKPVVTAIIAGRPVRHAYLGVAVNDAPSGGARVAVVRSGGPAAQAGIRVGDVITAVDGTKIPGADQLSNALEPHAPGDVVHLTVRRGGSTLDITVTLGTRPTGGSG